VQGVRCSILFGHMPNLDVVAILKLQHKEVKATVDRLAEAIRVLESLENRTGGRTGPRRMSAAGRERIAAAQRKRWAKLRLGKKK
jgi:hypothetical protein